MKLEVFKNILDNIRKQEEILDNAYKAGVDLINLMDNFHSVINTLLKVYYGEEGADWISWYLYDRDPNKGPQAWDKDKNPICYDDESLWREVEQCRLDNTEDYMLPTPMTDEERLASLKNLVERINNLV